MEIGKDCILIAACYTEVLIGLKKITLNYLHNQFQFTFNPKNENRKMGNEKIKNFSLILLLMLVVIGIPYLLYTLGSFLEINRFGYVNNWWVVLLFIVLLIAVFILGGIDLEKNLTYFFLLLFTVPFFILGIRLGDNSLFDFESYTLLQQKEQAIDQLDSISSVLEAELTSLTNQRLQDQGTQNPDFKNHEIIFFNSGSVQLSDFNKLKVKSFVANLENAILNIKGHTDGSGTKVSNATFSNKRAQNVADFVKSVLKENNTINLVKGLADEDKLVQNSNETNRSINRRVTIEIVGKNDAEKVARSKAIKNKLDSNKEQMDKLRSERDSLRKILQESLEG